ncbi:MULTISPECIES: DUF6737 family protein [Oscillatoriales]|uniref:DUF6737 family protein n=1 Tax=Oscillatoriophycideae TaxID=1301283 RepID=UPI001F559ECB|nr:MULTISPECIES: DUF6737 family protein [Oscillatoriales]
MSDDPKSKIDLNPWGYKPWWCQPWSIAVTGSGLIGLSWLLFKTVWVTVVVSLPVLIWMGFFLILWPQLMKQSTTEPYYPPSGSDSAARSNQS